MTGKFSTAGRWAAEALIVLLCVAGLFGTVQLGGQLQDISSRIHPGPEEEQRRLKWHLQIDAEIDDVLAGLAEDLDADRALVFLAHNGQTDLTGKIPFMFLSNTQAYLRPGLAWQEAWSRPTPLSAMSPTLRRIFRDPEAPRCVKVDRGDADVSAVLRARMIDRGVEATFVCPLAGQNGVVGLVTAEYLRRDSIRLPESDTLSRLAATAEYVHRAMTMPRK